MVAPPYRGPIGGGDGESGPRRGHCLMSACWGRQPPSVRAHKLGGRVVLPRTWSLPKERLWGMVAPMGTGTLAGGMGSPAEEVVVA